MIGSGQRDKLVERDATLANSFGKQNWKTCLDSRNAIRNPAKAGSRIWRELSRFVVVAKRTMIRRKQRENALLQPFPARLLARMVSRWRRANIFGAFHAQILQII